MTTRYLEWWKKLISAQPSPSKVGFGKNSKDGKKGTCGEKIENGHPPVPFGFPLKLTGNTADTVDPSPSNVGVGKKKQRWEKAFEKETTNVW